MKSAYSRLVETSNDRYRNVHPEILHLLIVVLERSQREAIIDEMVHLYRVERISQSRRDAGAAELGKAHKRRIALKRHDTRYDWDSDACSIITDWP